MRNLKKRVQCDFRRLLAALVASDGRADDLNPRQRACRSHGAI